MLQVKGTSYLNAALLCASASPTALGVYACSAVLLEGACIIDTKLVLHAVRHTFLAGRRGSCWLVAPHSCVWNDVT
jgi:hypothetical protein